MTLKTDFDEFSYTYKEILKNSLGVLKKDDGFFDLIKIKNLETYVIKENYVYDILDFGCGIGKLTGLLAKKFSKSNIYGYDISKKSLIVAEKENIGINNIEFNHKIPQARKYDYIIVSNVFHHIDFSQHADILNTIRQLLKPNGRVIVFEHNPFNPLTKYIVSICPFDVDAKLISLNNFIRLAGFCKFGVDLKNYILFFPWQLKMFRKIERYLKYIPLGAQYMVTFFKDNQR